MPHYGIPGHDAENLAKKKKKKKSQNQAEFV